MLNIYTDASFDDDSHLGAYCIVIADENDRRWHCSDADGLNGPNAVELEGLRQAAMHAQVSAHGEVTIYNDNVDAIKKVRAEFPSIKFQHIAGHQIPKSPVINEHMKCQHWADLMVGYHMKKRLASK